MPAIGFKMPDPLQRALARPDIHDATRLLQQWAGQGATVSAAPSAEEAMEILRRAAADVLVCDVGLPGEDGPGNQAHARKRPGKRSPGRGRPVQPSPPTVGP